MTNKELDKWIAKNVTLKKPYKVAMALTSDESGIALIEGELIGRSDVEQYCKDYPKYHCKIVDVYPEYTTDPAAAMEVLEKCYEKTNLSICTCKSPDGYKFWLPNGFSIALNATTLELAICLFAKKLFSKCERD